MDLLILALAILICFGLGAMLAGRRNTVSTSIACVGAVLACLVGMIPAFKALLGEKFVDIFVPWQVPYGSLTIGLDALSAIFLVAIFFLSALSAIYGAGYLLSHYRERVLGPTWFFFNLLVASMVVVVCARNGILFLVAWEVMAIASYFLVTFNDEREKVVSAGFTYLIATHIGTAFLFVFFAIMGKISGTMDFSGWQNFSALHGILGVACFLLALFGFGTKAGLIPLHVWLPEAHPAAPAHVSALMSGVMIKTGIYGILRAMTFFGPLQEWWGFALIAIGVVSGILGVLCALSQKDLKSLLAYSSVENIGIILLGLGMGIVGAARGEMIVAVCGFGGALLHVLNHSLFKGLLFLCAGNVVSATHSHNIDALGGLIKKMPRTGLNFLVGSVALAGLPPLNGFIGEFLIYFSSFTLIMDYAGANSTNVALLIPAVATIASLVLIGGLAQACFAKAFGITFLGEPRSDVTRASAEPGWKMIFPIFVLSGMCWLVGFAAPVIIELLAPAVSVVAGVSADDVLVGFAKVRPPLTWFVVISSAIFAASVVIYSLRKMLLKNRQNEIGVTWDCGFARPTARMQYTGESLIQPTTHFFRQFVFNREKLEVPDTIFPTKASFTSEPVDVFKEGFFVPVFRFIEKLLSPLRVLQNGSVHLYILYIALVLLLLLAWKLGGF